jgi:hypothetical protein
MSLNKSSEFCTLPQRLSHHNFKFRTVAMFEKFVKQSNASWDFRYEYEDDNFMGYSAM